MAQAKKKTNKKTVKKKTTPLAASKNTSLPQIGINAPHPKGVNELRKDYWLDHYVVFATARAKRPEQFSAQPDAPTKKEDCPFCPCNQDKIVLAQEIPAPTTYGWLFRSVVNLFGIMRPEGYMPSHIAQSANAYGHAEVIIETPEHGIELEELPKGSIANWLNFIARRVEDLRSRPGVRSVCAFKNRGRSAGASIAHSHTQLITTPMIPENMFKLRQAENDYYTKTGNNLLLDVVQNEKKAKKRFIAENEYASAFAPFASETPLEAWIVPKRHITSITLLTTQERDAIEDLLSSLLLRLNTLGKPAYNILFIDDGEYGQVQFHIRLHPRLSTPQAGFEYITGLFVNPTLPEDAASFYKKK